MQAEADQVELLKWLIQRSDGLRNSYSSRATLIISANALILASIVFLQDKILIASQGALKILITLLMLVTLVFLAASLIFAMIASVGPGSSRRMTGYKGDKRYFLSAEDTFENLKGYESFKAKFLSLNSTDIIDSACGELWIDLKLQQIRYKRLKKSIQCFLTSFVLLVVTLSISILFINNGTN